MNDLNPQYDRQARKLLKQGMFEAQVAESLMLQGLASKEAYRTVEQAAQSIRTDREKLSGFQKQSLISAALGLGGMVIGVGAAYAGTINFESLSIAPTLLAFGAIGWALSVFVGDLALWLAKHPWVIFIAAVLSMIGSAAVVFTFLLSF